jgi:hypothetical protein
MSFRRFVLVLFVTLHVYFFKCFVHKRFFVLYYVSVLRFNVLRFVIKSSVTEWFSWRAGMARCRIMRVECCNNNEASYRSTQKWVTYITKEDPKYCFLDCGGTDVSLTLATFLLHRLIFGAGKIVLTEGSVAAYRKTRDFFGSNEHTKNIAY